MDAGGGASLASASGETTAPKESAPGSPGVVEPVTPAFFRYRGRKYSQEKDFEKAAKESIKGSSTALDDDDVLLATAHKLFQEFAQDAGDGCTKLQRPEMAGLVASVAAELGENPREIGNGQALFYRYDFTGDDALDEEEGVQMVAALLRHHRDKKNPGKPGQPKLIQLEEKQVDEHFDLKKKLGKGGQGTVWLALDKASGVERVVKSFSKRNTNAPVNDIKDEFRLLRALDHPRVQRLYDIFEDRKNIYFISEPYKGGDLQSLVPKARTAGVRVTNRWLGRVMSQVLQGVAYLHSQHVMHCDLKEANAMLSNADLLEEPSIVVIDFGLADKMTTRKQRGCGTPGYMPPEVWTSQMWTPKGDVHSLGVMLYQMFAGEKCFPATSMAEMQRRTLYEEPDLEPLMRYGSLPNLVKSMVAKDFKQRPTCPKVLEAPFFTCLAESEEQDIPADIVNVLCKVGKKSEVQSAILADIADMQNLSHLQELNDAFMALDTDNSGVITEAEARAKLSETLPSAKVQGVIDALLGDDGQVAYTEFMGHMLLMVEADLDRVLWREFSALDKSKEGHLSESEISALLSRPALAEVLAGQGLGPGGLMDLMDKDCDGKISFEEFAAALHGEKNSNANDAAKAAVQDPAEPKKKTDAPAPTPPAEKPPTQATTKAAEPEVDVKWQSNTLTMYSTRRLMREAKWQNVAWTWCCTISCCWWIPLVFFKGAANVADDGCEVKLSVWLKVCAILMFAALPVDHCLYVLFGKCKAASCFKLARWLMFGAPVIYIGYSVSGFGMFAASSEEKCLKPGWSGIQPIALTLAWAIIGLILGCCMAALACCVFAVRNLPEDDDLESKVAPAP